MSKLNCVEHGRQEIVVERSGGEIIVLECGCTYRTDFYGCVRVSVLKPIPNGVPTQEFLDAFKRDADIVQLDGFTEGMMIRFGNWLRTKQTRGNEQTEDEFRLETLEEFYRAVQTAWEAYGSNFLQYSWRVNDAREACDEKLAKLERKAREAAE